MSIQKRRQREHAQRHDMIVSAARRMAEADGWDAVTTRKLAETIEYSQPVLYTHFENRDDIIRAVSVQGFAELSAALRQARAEAASPEAAIEQLIRTYVDFADANPRLYEVMFVRTSTVFFGVADTPPELLEAFSHLREAIAEIMTDGDADLVAEVTWASLHGLITLNSSGRLRPEHAPARLDYLIRKFACGRLGGRAVSPA